MPICKTGIPSLTYIDIHRWREREMNGCGGLGQREGEMGQWLC